MVAMQLPCTINAHDTVWQLLKPQPLQIINIFYNCILHSMCVFWYWKMQTIRWENFLWQNTLIWFLCKYLNEKLFILWVKSARVNDIRYIKFKASLGILKCQQTIISAFPFSILAHNCYLNVYKSSEQRDYSWYKIIWTYGPFKLCNAKAVLHHKARLIGKTYCSRSCYKYIQTAELHVVSTLKWKFIKNHTDPNIHVRELLM